MQHSQNGQHDADELNASNGSDEFDGPANFIGGDPETMEGQLVMMDDDEVEGQGQAATRMARAPLNLKTSFDSARDADAQIDASLSQKIARYTRAPSAGSTATSRADSRNRSSSRQSLTVPKAPVLRSSSRSRGERILSHEEREALEAEEGARRLRELMQKNGETMQKNKVYAGQAPPTSVRSTKELTIPESPKSLLSTRHGDKKYSSQSKEQGEEPEHNKTSNTSGSGENRPLVRCC